MRYELMSNVIVECGGCLVDLEGPGESSLSVFQ